jgi:hypothetical protein
MKWCLVKRRDKFTATVTFLVALTKSHILLDITTISFIFVLSKSRSVSSYTLRAVKTRGKSPLHVLVLALLEMKNTVLLLSSVLNL